jgi:hypothetical protein
MSRRCLKLHLRRTCIFLLWNNGVLGWNYFSNMTNFKSDIMEIIQSFIMMIIIICTKFPRSASGIVQKKMA